MNIKMKTTKTERKEIILCDDCRKNETEIRCECCKKDICKSCSVYNTEEGMHMEYFICKECYNKFPKFVQDNMESVLRSEHEGGAFSFDKQPLNPEKYKRKGFYIFVLGHDWDGSNVYHCKNKDEILEIMDEYSSEENEDIVSDVYDENGNMYEVSRKIELTKK